MTKYEQNKTGQVFQEMGSIVQGIIDALNSKMFPSFTHYVLK